VSTETGVNPAILPFNSPGRRQKGSTMCATDPHWGGNLFWACPGVRCEKWRQRLLGTASDSVPAALGSFAANPAPVWPAVSGVKRAEVVVGQQHCVDPANHVYPWPRSQPPSPTPDIIPSAKAWRLSSGNSIMGELRPFRVRFPLVAK